MLVGMALRDIPTVFVHGGAAPGDVRYAEDRLRDVSVPASAIDYEVLWVDSEVTAVAVEIGVAGRAVSSRGTGASVREAADRCFAALDVSLRSA
jgi:hypothetical protein